MALSSYPHVVVDLRKWIFNETNLWFNINIMNEETM